MRRRGGGSDILGIMAGQGEVEQYNNKYRNMHHKCVNWMINGHLSMWSHLAILIEIFVEKGFELIPKIPND